MALMQMLHGGALQVHLDSERLALARARRGVGKLDRIVEFLLPEALGHPLVRGIELKLPEASEGEGRLRQCGPSKAHKRSQEE
jgi:Arc/MetJ family transcription regulator